MLKLKKVVVGISGGVDSAVTALLLKIKGFDLHGVFMKNWDIRDEQNVCSSDEDFRDAQVVCDKLDIPLKQVNFVKEYWNEVFMYTLKEYENGCTPNPDILCNRHVKFNHFYQYARNVLKADCVATGHYARTSFGSYLENYKLNSNVKLLRARDTFKDQTFFLCQVEQDALRSTMFPLGNLLKSEVKEIAKNNGLEKVALKKESMGICFIGNRNFKDFISEYISDNPGDFVDIDSGKKVGEHKGLHHWTLGQRSRIAAVPEGYFVARRDKISNTIYVGMGTKHPAIHSSLFFTSGAHWITEMPDELKRQEVFKCQFTFQHTHGLVECEVFQTKLGLIVLLPLHKRAITEGQYAVFYKDDQCLGGARIVSSGVSNFALYWLQNHKKCEVAKILKRYHDCKSLNLYNQQNVEKL